MSETILDEMKHNLIVLPKPPKELQLMNPAIVCVLGNGRTVKSLMDKNRRGLIVCKRAQFDLDPGPLEASDPPSSSGQGSSPDKIQHGCVYFPAPRFDRVIIVKSVNNLSKIETIEKVCNSIQDQLQCLNNAVCLLNQNNQITSEKLNVRLFVCLPQKVMKTHPSNLKRMKATVSCYQENDTIYPKIFLNTQFVSEEEFHSKLGQYLNTSFVSELSNVQRLIERLILSYAQELQHENFYQLCPQKFKFLDAQPCSIDQIDEIINLFNFYFPNRNQKLETIPHFNQLADNMLYSYTDQGEPGSLQKYAPYMGEVRIFSEKLLSKLKNPSGILIKGFSSDHLRTILNGKHLTPQQFEIDWLYLGSSHIVVFEVGMSENPDHPRSALGNKIRQCFTTLLPQMQLILYSIWVPYKQKSETKTQQEFSSLVEDLLKIVIFIPGLSECTLVSELSVIKNACKDHQNLLKWMAFLVESEESSRNLKLVGFNNNFEVINCETTLHQIFQGSIAAPEKDSFLNYFQSVICAASLNAVLEQKDANNNSTALDIDRRYIRLFKSWVQNQQKSGEKKLTVGTDFVFVLSPQQHRILHEGRSHLLITGEPGSGKTALLLAMCEKIAVNEDVTEILFVYDETKTLFEKYLTRILDKICNIARKSKVTKVGIRPNSLLSYVNKLEEVSQNTFIKGQFFFKSLLPKNNVHQNFRYTELTLVLFV